MDYSSSTVQYSMDYSSSTVQSNRAAVAVDNIISFAVVVKSEAAFNCCDISYHVYGVSDY